MISLERRDGRPQRIGHRGAKALAPENTLAAFRRALDVGVTTIETDVGVTRDGVVVIAHDRRLNPALTRGADGKWLVAPGPPIRTLSLDELAGYDVGRIDPASSYAKTFPQPRPADGERIPLPFVGRLAVGMAALVVSVLIASAIAPAVLRPCD